MPSLTGQGVAAQQLASLANATGAAAGTVPVATGNNTFQNTASKSLDTSDAPQALGTANPGTGSNGASPSDHVHPMPTSSQLADASGSLANGQAWIWNSTAGKLMPGSVGGTTPLYQMASNGQITLPRGHVDDSGSYSQTPGTQVLHLTYFIATAAQSVGHIKLGTGGTASSSNTLTEIGLYSVSGSTLTLVASSANQTGFGSYAQENVAMQTAYTLTVGATYAVGLLQVGSTSASVLGNWVNDEYLGISPTLCATLSNQSSLPSSITSGLGSTGFAIFYFLTS